MSSGQEYYPSDESVCSGPRRSKRLTKYDIRKPPAKILRKTRDNAGKKFTPTRKDKKLPKKEEQKSNNSTDEKESHTFSGEPLIPQELHQLFVKFSKDGHFRCGSSVSSSPCSIVADTANDVQPNKKKKRNGEKRTTVTCEKIIKEDKTEEKESSSCKLDPLSVTCSNSLPNATGGTLHISTSKSQSIPSFLSERNKNWSGPIICRNFLSSGSFRSGNGIDLSSNTFARVAPPKPYQLASVANPCKTTFNEQNLSNSWKSNDNNSEQLNNRNDQNSRRFYHNGKNSQIEYSDNSAMTQSARSNRENVGNSYASGTKLPSLQARPNNSYCSFDQTGSTHDKFESKQLSMGSSSFITPTESSYGNISNNWNDIDVNIQNILSSDNQSMNDGFDTQNSINHGLSNYRGYNTEDQNLNDICTQNYGDNGNTTMDYNNKLNGHHLSLMAWNSLQVYQNPYLTGSELSYVSNNYNCPISYDETLSSIILNEPSNHAESTNYWSQKNPSNRGLFPYDESKTSTTIGTNNFMSVAPLTTSTINDNVAIARINNRGINEGNFDFHDFPDSQDGDFCPTVSSTCSFDDDISYENYMNSGLVRDNSATNKMSFDHDFDSGVLTKMKAELRPLYNPSTNYMQHNNDSKRNDDNSFLYEFDTKSDVGISSDRLTLDNSGTA